VREDEKRVLKKIETNIFGKKLLPKICRLASDGLVGRGATVRVAYKKREQRLFCFSLGSIFEG
jgi:hypothetical protein